MQRGTAPPLVRDLSQRPQRKIAASWAGEAEDRAKGDQASLLPLALTASSQVLKGGGGR